MLNYLLKYLVNALLAKIEPRLLVELLSIAVVVAVAWFIPGFGAAWFRTIERGLRRAAQKRVWTVAGVAVFSLALSAAVSVAVKPYPHGQDEFSYVLAGDTFAHGRLTNPTHPLWVHFESMHIIHQPTYASKYPPAQGLSLALGQVLCGHQLAGVWLSTALACAAITWMLLGWLPARWALLGGLLAAVHPTMIVWSQSFMGGTVATAGGALVVGALRRLASSPRLREGFFLGAGIAVLAVSRPYEGVVLCVLAVVAWIVWHGRILPPRILLAVAGMVAAALIWLGYYNWRVTGHPLRLPYLVHDELYQVTRSFVWCHEPAPPHYRHKVMQDQGLGQEMQDSRIQSTFRGWLRACPSKLQVSLEGFFPLFVVGLPMWLLVIPLAALPAILRSRWMRGALVLVLGAIAAEMPVTHLNMHYVAPVFGVVVLFAVQVARQIRTWRWGSRQSGRLLVRLAVVLCYLSVLPTTIVLSRLYRDNWGHERQRVLEELIRAGGRHLVIVRYGDGHSPFNEWVYNAADIDNAPVVWAREMDAVHDQALLQYFRNRQVWLVEADTAPPTLIPYAVQH
jgi:hypothetical protein